MSWWKPKTTHVTNDEQEWWSTRKVSCDACGEEALHYEAQWNAEVKVFIVPYAGLNGASGARWTAATCGPID